MGNHGHRLLPLLGVLLICTNILTMTVATRLQITGRDSLSTEQRSERPRVAKRSIQACSSSHADFCLNKGQCMYFVDINEHHCKCERGYYGPRCATAELLVQPMAEEQIVVIIFCVILVIIGLSGTLYFCCKWWKKNKFPGQPKRHGYKGVQTVRM